MDIRRRQGPQVDAVNLRGHLDVAAHLRRRDEKRNFPAELFLYIGDLLLDLKQPRPAADAEGLQRWRDGEADGLVRPGLVGDDKAGLQRVEAPLHTFHRRVKGFEIDAEIGGFHPFPP